MSLAERTMDCEFNEAFPVSLAKVNDVSNCQHWELQIDWVLEVFVEPLQSVQNLLFRCFIQIYPPHPFIWIVYTGSISDSSLSLPLCHHNLRHVQGSRLCDVRILVRYVLLIDHCSHF